MRRGRGGRAKGARCRVVGTAPSPAPTAPAHGGPAFTGAAGVIPLTVGGVLLPGAGAGIVIAVRRRAARPA